MRRKEWFELHDHRLFPGFLRDLITDALQAMWNSIHSYRGIVPKLQAALKEAGTRRIVDLCSGGGGPWLRLYPELTKDDTSPVSVFLTDKYPNKRAFEHAQTVNGINFHQTSVDATQIPAELDGFRTIFTSFHHYSPSDARASLADAVAQNRGIGVFETPNFHVSTLLVTMLVPLICLCLTPGIRPFRWSRLLWTYLLPVVPLVLVVDGILSCLRAYSLEDLRELTHGLGEGYCWDVGRAQGGYVGVTYLIGRPCAGPAMEPALASEVSSI